MAISDLGAIIESQLLCILNAIFCCAGIWILSKKLISAISNRIYNLLKDYGDSWLFSITKGDKNRIEKINITEKADKISIFLNLFGTIILNVACGVIANKLF